MNCNAWKLTRVEPREKPRTDWPARWQAAGDSVNWQGAFKDEFIALKTSPIWRALGSGVGGFDDATQSDSPPFAINSGMGWIGIDFDAEEKPKITNKSSLPNEKGHSMNQPNKVNLILLIAQRFTDEMCANVLERFNNHPLLIANELVNEAANWDESKHPRASDGKFSSVPGGGATDTPKRKNPYGEKKLRQRLDQIDEDRQDELDAKWAKSGLLERMLQDPESPKTNHYGEHEDISTNHVDRIPKGSRRRFYGYKDTQKIREYLEEAKKLKVKKGEGQTPREILLEKLKMIEEGQGNDYSDGSKYPGWYYKPGLNGNYDANEALYEQLEIVRKLGKVKEIESEEKKKAKSRDLNHKRYARLNDVEDELTRLVEAYGTDGLTGKVKKDGVSASPENAVDRHNLTMCAISNEIRRAQDGLSCSFWVFGNNVLQSDPVMVASVITDLGRKTNEVSLVWNGYGTNSVTVVDGGEEYECHRLDMTIPGEVKDGLDVLVLPWIRIGRPDTGFDFGNRQCRINGVMCTTTNDISWLGTFMTTNGVDIADLFTPYLDRGLFRLEQKEELPE